MSNEVRLRVAEILQSDEALLSMLSPDNVNWSKPESTDKHPKWSIIPADKFQYEKVDMPVVTIQMGDDILVGTRLVETVFYIRCYNNSQKTYVDITAALARIKRLLDGTTIQLTDSRLIDLVWQGNTAELEDQAYKLPFREARFVVRSV